MNIEITNDDNKGRKGKNCEPGTSKDEEEVG
jgi:hypothetical protein